jgi:hypothetical protein
MARKKKEMPEQGSLLYYLSIGYIASLFPLSMIRTVLLTLGKGSQRVRLLPAELVVYFVIAMCIWREPRQDKILRIITESVNFLNVDVAISNYPGCAAISQARSKLGPDPLRELANQALHPLAPIGLPGAWYKGKRLVALDGTTFPVPDDKENAGYFGYPGVSRGNPAFPHARVESLVEIGTHAILAAEIGPYNSSEISLSKTILEKGKLTNEMLLLADRNYYGYKLWSLALDSNADLLWRIKKNLILYPDNYLSDGSYFSTIFDSKDRNASGLRVRVIEYKLKKNSSERYRLITNMLDPVHAPALELATLYHERWDIELCLSEIKTEMCAHSSKYATLIRSRRPDLVLQEIWGLILAHYSIKNLAVKAAIKKEYDPDDISFSNAVEIIRRKLPHSAASPPCQK